MTQIASHRAKGTRHPRAPEEIIFVGAGCDQADEWVHSILCASDKPQIQVVFLDPESDGIETISRVFNEHSGVRSVHIVSAESTSHVQLGNVLLCDANIESYAARIAAWPMAFADNAEINLYGCSLTDDDGENLFNDLSVLTATRIRNI